MAKLHENPGRVHVETTYYRLDTTYAYTACGLHIKYASGKHPAFLIDRNGRRRPGTTVLPGEWGHVEADQQCKRCVMRKRKMREWP